MFFPETFALVSHSTSLILVGLSVTQLNFLGLLLAIPIQLLVSYRRE